MRKMTCRTTVGRALGPMIRATSSGLRAALSRLDANRRARRSRSRAMDSTGSPLAPREDSVLSSRGARGLPDHGLFSDVATAKGALIKGGNHLAQVLPVGCSRQAFDLVIGAFDILRRGLGKIHAGLSKQRIVAQDPQGHGRTVFQVTTGGLQAEDLMRFQVDDAAAGAMAEAAAIMGQKLHGT